MRHVLFGFLGSLLAGAVFSLLLSLVICLGANPELRTLSDWISPLLGIFTGAALASRGRSWKIGAAVGLLNIACWAIFWLYVMGRWSPLLWIEQAIPGLTLAHFAWWLAALLAGLAGGIMRQPRVGTGVLLLAALFLCGAVRVALIQNHIPTDPASINPVPGYRIETQGPLPDGTVVYLQTFDFSQQPQLHIGLYDCDSDDANPFDDANASYMGLGLPTLVEKLRRHGALDHHRLLSVINGGFFGASGFAIAHHEEPIVQEGRPLYDVDLLRPREQAWLFAVNSPAGIQSGQPRFSMEPALDWSKLGNFQSVLGGVRPLRVNGQSVPLLPGAGNTRLHCSRTSVGWSADGSQFFILVAYDINSAAFSQYRKRKKWPQMGGWDVAQVQQFWEQRRVPSALLFDGGESSQLAFAQPDGGYHELPSGYQYSATLGYLRQRPLLVTLPILPPSEAHRGVLNYLYVDSPSHP